RLLVLLIMACIYGHFAFAQDGAYGITGTVVDTASGQSLAKSSIVLVHAKDSMLYTFTRTDDAGRFNLGNLDTGEYMLFATFPEYADYVERFTLDSETPMMDFGRVGLVLRAKLLEEVLVSRSQAITIRGDTTEYDAASFTI